jgi:UDP-N-acetylmuramate--alanine ligase
MELNNLKHIHFTGIKGVAMTSLALCAQDLGIQVSGSDTKEIFVTDEVLAKRGIKWIEGFSAENITQGIDLVITTGAHGGLTNPEVLAAKAKGIPVMTHAEALAFFAKGKETIAVCGVGGKTTVSSMIANLFSFAGEKPSFAIGVGDIFPLNTPGKFDREGKMFICEADEFAASPGIDNRPRFSFLSPKVLVCTNIEHDHPDIYPTLEDTIKAFRELFEKIPSHGLLVASTDNRNVSDVINGIDVPIVSYGFKGDPDWKIGFDKIVDGQQEFDLVGKNGEKYHLSIKVPGLYNILNATAAFIVGKFYSIPDEKLIAGIADFAGVKRRFEKVGETKSGALVYDDYAHHPEEIKAVLSAAKEWFPGKRIVAVFQPHTYSRTKALFNEFAQSFGDADIVALMDIYSSAREEKDPEVSSALLAQETQKYHSNVYYTKGHEETLEWLKGNIKKDDVVLTLGAGDIFYLHAAMLEF